MPTTVVFGNVAPHEVHDADTAPADAVRNTPDDTGQVPFPKIAADKAVRVLDPTVSHTTTCVIPDGVGLAQAIQLVEGLWPYHSTEKPGWVLSDNPALQLLIEDTLGVPAPADGDLIALVTNAALDFTSYALSDQTAIPTISTLVQNFMALSAATFTPNAADTILNTEITTPSGGLIRAAATFAHTAAASTYTLSTVFTANGNDSLPVTIKAVGVFTANNGAAVTGVTTTGPATNTVNKTGHGLVNGQVIVFDQVGASGLTATTQAYYLVGRQPNTFQVSLTLNGAAVALTTDGTGPISFHTTGVLLFEANLGTAVTLSASGDNVTITETVTV